MCIRNDFFKSLPFVTVCYVYEKEYIGILNIKGKNLTSMYVFDLISSTDGLIDILNLGEMWWWECNRNIPISVFMHEKIEKFEFCKKAFPTKDISVLSGPVVSISAIPTKRIKRNTTILKKKQ